MKKINIKTVFILLYIILFIFIGYHSVEPSDVTLRKNFHREDISLLYLFIFNYSNVMFLLLTSFLGGIFSIFSITNVLIKTGIALHIVHLNTNIGILNLFLITTIHGIFEFSAIGIVLGISIDIFSIFFKSLILNSNIKLIFSIKNYIKKNLYNKIIYITILLSIAALLEYFVSAQIFSSLGIK